MSTYTLIGAVVGIASGIFIRSFFIVSLTGVVVVCACALLLTLLFRYTERLSVSYTTCVGLMLVGVCSGVWRMDSAERAFGVDVGALRDLEGQQVVIDGIVSRDVEYTESGRTIVVRSRSINDFVYETDVRAAVPIGRRIVYGDHVVLEGKLERPKSFETESGRTFHYEEYLRAQGITHILAFASVTIRTRESGYSMTETFYRYLYAGKALARNGIEKVLPEPQAGFGEGLLLGEKHALGSSLEEAFRTIGIVHIIVLSGYNLTIIAESIMRLLARFLFPRPRAFVGIVAIILFALMVGLSPTVARAGLMAVLVLIARAFGRTYVAFVGLGFAAGVMLLWNPYVLLFDPGFALSFMATLGLIFGSPFVERVFAWTPTRLQLREYVTSTTATQIFVTPYLLYTMGTMSLIALIANILILPVVPLAMLLTFVSGIAGAIFGEVALIVGYPAYLALSYILWLSETLARIPYALIYVPEFSAWIMVTLYIVLALSVGWLWHRREEKVE